MTTKPPIKRSGRGGEPLAGVAGRLVVRPALRSDVASVVALERSIAEAAHWPRREYAAMVGPPSESLVERRLLVAERGGVLLGYAVGKLLRAGDATLGELENIGVAASERRFGAGRALCVALLAWWDERGAGSLELEVRAGNAAAIALYEGMGWRRAGLRRGYYHDPVEDAVLMARDPRDKKMGVQRWIPASRQPI